MPVHSAALIPYRIADDGVLEVFIVHMGGPFWSKKEDGGWSVVKGEFDPEIESSREVADREFEEEIGLSAPVGERVLLGDFKQSSGKIITAFAVESAANIEFVRSNTFEMEWPKGSGKFESFPEVDRASWFTLEASRPKLLKGHLPILDRLVSVVGESHPSVLLDRETTLF